ncbi:hypothetical protein ACTG9Q_09485 [Actinokineospora sp. 24-640]
MTRPRGISTAFPASRPAVYAVVCLWSGIAAAVAALLVLRLGDTGWLPPLLVGAGAAMGVAAAADPLFEAAERGQGRSCVRVTPRRRSRPPGTTRPAVRSVRARPRGVRP